MNKKTSAIALVLALSAAALGVGALRGSAHHEPPPVTEGTPATEARSAGGVVSALAPSGRELRLGSAFSYEVKSERVYSDAAGKVLGSMTVSGTLELAVVGAKDGGAAVRAVLANPSAKELAAPFFFVLAEDGHVTSYGFDKAIPGEARRQLIALVASLQIAPASVERVEGDVSGEALVSYSKTGSEVVRTKSRYQRVLTPAGLVSPTSIGGEYTVSSRAVFVVDASGWPSSLREQESLSAVFSAGRMTTVASTTAKLVARGEDKSHVGSYESAQAGFDADVEAVGQSVELARRNADLGLVKGATFSQLTGELGSAKDGHVRNRAVARLSALLRTSPEATHEARSALLGKGTDEATKKSIAGALGSVPGPEAQKVLSATLGSAEVSSSVKVDAAISLGQQKQITPEAKEALRSAAKSTDSDLASAATLALGAASRTGGEGAADIVDELVARLAGAATAEEKMLALDALGNSGSPRALEAILGYVADPSSALRAAALGALKFQSSARALEALSAGMFDADLASRRAALASVGQQDVTPFLDPMNRLFEHESDVETRLLAVRVLARSVNTVTAVESLLAAVSHGDKEPRVRDAAMQALSKPKPREH